jgi:hypothetical protein
MYALGVTFESFVLYELRCGLGVVSRVLLPDNLREAT